MTKVRQECYIYLIQAIQLLLNILYLKQIVILEIINRPPFYAGYGNTTLP
jgi:hypothetical protein